MSLELVFLGTGTSAGVPMIGCECNVCRSSDPRDQRSRPSVMIRYPDPASPDGQRRFLIDTAPELRQQVIRLGLKRIDGVLFTHAHADHIFGLDDLRRFNALMNGPIDIYAEQQTLTTLHHTFRYIFEPHKNVNQSFIATLLPHALEAGLPVRLFGATWTPLRLLHGRLPILGFRVDWGGKCEEPSAKCEVDAKTGKGDSASVKGVTSLAYCTDLSAIPPETYPLLEDLDVLVIDALRYRHHPTHLTVEQALGQIDRVQPRQALLTHIAHDILHADLETRLPEHVRIAYDGLEVNCANGRSRPQTTSDQHG